MKEWMDCWHGCKVELGLNSSIHGNLPASTILVMYWWNLSNITILCVQCNSWPLLDSFTQNVIVLYYTRWIFNQFACWSILGAPSSGSWFIFSTFHVFRSSNAVHYVIFWQNIFISIVTQGSIAIGVGRWSEVCAKYPRGRVSWFSMRLRNAVLYLGNGSQSSSLPILLEYSFQAIFMHSLAVFIPNNNSTPQDISQLAISII